MGQLPIQFEVTEVVHAPLDAVWNVIGDFGTEHRWTRSMARCERDTPEVAVGTSRTCTLPKPLMGRTSVRERLTEFTPGVALSYDLEGPAGPFLRASSRWSVCASEEAQTTLVTVEGRFIPRNWLARFLIWPIAKPLLQRLTRKVVGELNAFVATH
jgi:hypothetical protein